MASGSDLKKLTKARLNSVKILKKAQDWDMAGYLMGYVLECALKSATCKTLKLDEYPDNTKSDEKIRSFFQTHSMDRLLIVSGASDIFKLTTITRKVFQNWSEFTVNYPANWTEKRYEIGHWNKEKVEKCYNNLTETPYGILNQIKKRW